MNAYTLRQMRSGWLALLIVGLVAGGASVAYMLANGHSHSFNVTREIPWGILVSSYEYLMILSAGLVLWVSYALMTDGLEGRWLHQRALMLAATAMLGGFSLMVAELNHPLRMALYVLASPNLASPLWWMGVFYGFMIGALALQVVVVFKQLSLLATLAGFAGLLSSLGVLANMGAVLGLVESRALWHGPLIPVYFLLAAILAGGAALVLLAFVETLRGRDIPAELFERTGRILAFFTLALAFLFTVKVISGLYGRPPEKYPAMLALLSGPLAANFWLFEVLLGLVLPLVLLGSRTIRTPRTVTLAGSCALVGAFFMRYDLVIAGQLVAMRGEGGGHGLLHYVPSLTEMGIVIGALALCLLLYSLAEKLFGLEGTSTH